MQLSCRSACLWFQDTQGGYPTQRPVWQVSTSWTHPLFKITTYFVWSAFLCQFICLLFVPVFSNFDFKVFSKHVSYRQLKFLEFFGSFSGDSKPTSPVLKKAGRRPRCSTLVKPGHQLVLASPRIPISMFYENLGRSDTFESLFGD